MKGNNLRLSFVVSLLLHLFLIIILILLEQKSKKEEEPKKIKVGNVQLKEYQQPKIPKAPPPATSKAAPKQQPAPEQPPKPKPKEVPKKVEKPTPKVKEKPVKKEVPKPKPVKKVPKQPVEAPESRTKTTETNTTKKSLESFLSQKSAPSLNDVANSFVDQKIEKLYGNEFGTFTKEQKEFIRDNLSAIGSITQKHLKYPSLAGQLQQKGTNVVEFNLHPNGDISDLKLVDKTGYSMLDKNSIRTIEIAYKDYPRPKTTTKIKIYVQYILY